MRLLLWLLCSAVAVTFAQTETAKKEGANKKKQKSTKEAKKEEARRRVALYLRDGSRFEGQPLPKEGKFFVLKLEKAKLRVPESLVKKVVEMTEERRFVVMAFEEEADAEWAARRLRMNDPPSHIARLESLHPSAATDAIIDFLPRSALPEKLAQVVFSAKERQVPEPFELGGFWWVVRVEKTRWSEPKEAEKPPQKKPQPKKQPQKAAAIKELRLGQFSVVGDGPKAGDAATFTRDLVRGHIAAEGIKITTRKDAPALCGEVGYKVAGMLELFSIKLWVEKQSEKEGKKEILAETGRLTVQGRSNLSPAIAKLVRRLIGRLKGR